MYNLNLKTNRKTSLFLIRAGLETFKEISTLHATVSSDVSQLFVEDSSLQYSSHYLSDESQASGICSTDISLEKTEVVVPYLENCSVISDDRSITTYKDIFNSNSTVIWMCLGAFLLLIYQKLDRVLSGPGGLRGYLVREALNNVLKTKPNNPDSSHIKKMHHPNARLESTANQRSITEDLMKTLSHDSTTYQKLHKTESASNASDLRSPNTSPESNIEKIIDQDLYSSKTSLKSSKPTKKIHSRNNEVISTSSKTILDYILNKPNLLKNIYPSKLQQMKRIENYFDWMLINPSTRIDFEKFLEKHIPPHLIKQKSVKNKNHSFESDKKHEYKPGIKRNRKELIDSLNNYSYNVISKSIIDSDRMALFSGLEIQQILMESSKVPTSLIVYHVMDINKGPVIIELQNDLTNHT
jgi:hypothetical protein